MAVSLIFMRRYDEAEKIQIQMEEQGTKNVNERAQFSWHVRYALLHMFRDEWELAHKQARLAATFMPRVSLVWFMGVYFWAVAYVVRALMTTTTMLSACIPLFSCVPFTTKGLAPVAPLLGEGRGTACGHIRAAL